MDTLFSLAHGFTVATQPVNLLVAFIGCFVGTVIGALPGIGPVNGIAILIPLAFSLDLSPVSALILLTSVYYGSMFGGRIASILLNIPGDSSAVVTCIDGFPMAKKGLAADALAISAISSFAGGTLATIGLTVLAPTLAMAAIHFGPREYFALYVMAIVIVGGIATGNPAKTLVAGLLGLAIGTVGIDPATGIPRFTFGAYELYEGIDFVIVAIGLFAISEFLVYIEQRRSGPVEQVPVGRRSTALRRLTYPATSLRAGLLGFVIGVLPGAGATLASFMGYALEKRVSDKDGTFGKGDPRGVAAPEAADNAAAGGSLVPMLTLGVPGSGTTAIMLGMLVTLNVQPGPLLFQQQPEIVWGLVAALYVSNVILLVLNIPLVGLFAKLLTVPPHYLMPGVVTVSFLGVYSVNQNSFDLLMMVGFGVFGYLLRKLGIPLVPVVLGIILGTPMEQSLRRAMAASGGDVWTLLESPLALALHAVTACMILVAIVREARRRHGEAAAARGA
ncbi:tripartite tricarboxylate transporter permease [Teichococcus aestuarii]|uniref:Tripartite tricarboxylate transporter TctA n=1 Tax=Teichococcus aestuarii TaxID=568898 RepID=A0A2U1V176_9PROT|nr:tripartite tricarboxylate transporter permease [Pseudoroseomonas aestuarii]PWC27656.1 tripartite tricarboxylate transporter TctA [Pseudoroseomonas aestuarii]